MRNFEFNNNKNDLHHDKEHKKLHIRHLNRFLFLKWFSSYTMSNTHFKASTQFLLRDFGSIFAFKTKIT